MASSSGPFCVFVECPTPTICQLASATRIKEDERILHHLERASGLCLSPPPFNMIQNCLSKISQEQASIVMICHYWPSQSWFPMMLQLACGIPRIFPPQTNLLTSCRNENHPLIMNGSLRLVAWRLSGVASDAKAFRKRLQTAAFHNGCIRIRLEHLEDCVPSTGP